MEEEEVFTNIYGKRITLRCRSHSTSCREFTIISSPKTSASTRAAVSVYCLWLLACDAFFPQITTALSGATLVALAGSMLYSHFAEVDRESVLLTRGSPQGVLRLSRGYACGRESVALVETRRIKDIVINEAFYMFRIIYYLCVLLKDPADPGGVAAVVPLFESSKPRLSCLQKVYRGCQEILSADDRDDTMAHGIDTVDSEVPDHPSPHQSSKPRLSRFEEVYKGYQEILSVDDDHHHDDHSHDELAWIKAHRHRPLSEYTHDHDDVDVTEGENLTETNSGLLDCCRPLPSMPSISKELNSSGSARTRQDTGYKIQHTGLGTENNTLKTQDPIARAPRYIQTKVSGLTTQTSLCRLTTQIPYAALPRPPFHLVPLNIPV